MPPRPPGLGCCLGRHGQGAWESTRARTGLAASDWHGPWSSGPRWPSLDPEQPCNHRPASSLRAAAPGALHGTAHPFIPGMPGASEEDRGKSKCLPCARSPGWGTRPPAPSTVKCPEPLGHRTGTAAAAARASSSSLRSALEAEAPRRRALGLDTLPTWAPRAGLPVLSEPRGSRDKRL